MSLKHEQYKLKCFGIYILLFQISLDLIYVQYIGTNLLNDVVFQLFKSLSTRTGAEYILGEICEKRTLDWRFLNICLVTSNSRSMHSII